MLAEVAIVSLNNDFSMLSCPLHRGNNSLNQGEVPSVLRLHIYGKESYHIGHVSQEDIFCHNTFIRIA
jgi:hypothetical protein